MRKIDKYEKAVDFSPTSQCVKCGKALYAVCPNCQSAKLVKVRVKSTKSETFICKTCTYETYWIHCLFCRTNNPVSVFGNKLGCFTSLCVYVFGFFLLYVCLEGIWDNIKRKNSFDQNPPAKQNSPNKEPSKDEELSKEKNKEEVFLDKFQKQVQENKEKIEKEKKAQIEAIKKATQIDKEKEAKRKAEETKVIAENLEKFLAEIKKNKTLASFVDGVIHERSLISDQEYLVITVKDNWHVFSKPTRLKNAEGLWGIWSKILPLNKINLARIKIIDLRSNEVGGSQIQDGSNIWVKD